MSLESAVQEEISRVEAEENASRTRVERAGDAAAAPAPAPAPAPDDGGEAAEVIKAIEQLPPEVATQILVAGLDIIAPRALGPKYELTERERALMVKVWTPAVAFYLPRLSVHPLVIPAVTTCVVYGLKSLPPGALANLLGGGGPRAAEVAVPEAPKGSAPDMPPQAVNVAVVPA